MTEYPWAGSTTPFTTTAEAIHLTAVEKGFYENPRSFIESCYLIADECHEAGDAWIRGNDDDIEEEFADVLIRLLDTWLNHVPNADIEGVIAAKMKKNEGRPRMHGKRL